jgi:transketolase
MRGQIIDAIFQRMATNPDIFFLTADMGINLVEKFAEKYPNRFLNVGIAEQNLVGVSAGLANLGFRPFAYTISNFAVHRCFEQIRNDIGIHDYPLVLLGTSTGYDNAPLGPTHHIIDDWGAIKSIPKIDIYCPSSVTYAAFLVDYLLLAERPAYVRIPKG